MIKLTPPFNPEWNFVKTGKRIQPVFVSGLLLFSISNNSFGLRLDD